MPAVLPAVLLWLAAFPAWSETHLLSVSLGSSRSEAAEDLGKGGYELADGRKVDFRDWYEAKWPDFNVQFLTEIRPDLGLIWGISTGEQGDKYRIAPGLHLGVIWQIPTGERSRLTLSATTMIGGSLREKACVADYGAIGGIQKVNCRLAATWLPPEETLDYLARVSARDDSRVALSWTMEF
ncbi:hypothetical protein LAZ40_04675 [Cereibacter sphaeroides]|uniref:hypothetical protein n=1 Tax=Cereibacter sphaeroides TaxID=1063 RepID=UPI001F3F751E|nr:hypothetical protein [Cereibacter sphaeroides]MCE6958350.1 hypothetical protein [Cereibacter sphaeroides]MCE6972217.1 hypothetical protein [Cereibacter sphaeroides]